MSDFDVLIQLYHAPEHAMRRVDIARQVLLTPSGITRLLDGLERCGVVGEEVVRERRARELRRADGGGSPEGGGAAASRTRPTSTSCSAPR